MKNKEKKFMNRFMVTVSMISAGAAAEYGRVGNKPGRFCR